MTLLVWTINIISWFRMGNGNIVKGIDMQIFRSAKNAFAYGISHISKENGNSLSPEKFLRSLRLNQFFIISSKILHYVMTVILRI